MLNKILFQQNLETICPEFKNAKFLLAVSGGVDSMVLFDLFKVSKLSFEVAHINYGLREKDSEKDEQLVKKICVENQIPFHLYKVSEIDDQPKNSIQEWARNLRYDFLKKIKKEKNLDFIVTAHHLNDDLETFLINVSRGSGIKGLSGIPKNENRILRPLLNVSKAGIYEYAKENNVEFREDLSNQKNDYLRNKIRNEVAPKLLEINKTFLENFAKSISYLEETRSFVQEKILETERKLITEDENQFKLDKKGFFQQSDFVQFEILQKFGFISPEEILKMKNAETGKIFISAKYKLSVDRENLFLKEIVNETEADSGEELILELNSQNEIIFPENIKKEIREYGTFNWIIDEDKIELPLKLRQKKASDIFHPIGMIGKKKVSKFFKDEKLPIFAHQKIWILCDGKSNILGIIPFRQDRRFAAVKETSQIIKIKL